MGAYQSTPDFFQQHPPRCIDRTVSTAAWDCQLLCKSSTKLEQGLALSSGCIGMPAITVRLGLATEQQACHACTIHSLEVASTLLGHHQLVASHFDAACASAA
eukprot:TRINITY_DN1833_c0_g1_i4.p2 TRINITY_DN1833_c0_g1~~TRINITY_DN1833_c0_g1_i4.p2  ORF type:complete len:103 (-),score=17.21 TRINITY_DN1833_c0_g1_i4:465-773(-)